mmetsp:Transcript_40169/g.114811  ORF Transcript_40169/g.114811 Transcript_40169/m.114811 type:complete len:254 (+) Transcript_40169:1361-2122(+)
MAHREAATGRHLDHVSHLSHGTSGMCQDGNPPSIRDTSLTTGVLIPFGRRIPHSYTMARSRPTRDGGMMRAQLTLPYLPIGMSGSLGNNSMTNITMRTSMIISHVVSSPKPYHSLLGRKPKSTGSQLPEVLTRTCRSFFWNVSICDMKMTTASPLKKPKKAVFGMSFTRFAQRSTPQSSCRMPVSTIVKRRYSRRSLGHLSPKGPSSSMMTLMTTASAPAQPEIIPGRPPRTPVMMPMKKEPYRPCRGCTPAT